MNTTLHLVASLLVSVGSIAKRDIAQVSGPAEEVDFVSQDDFKAFHSDLGKIETSALSRVAALMPEGEPETAARVVVRLAVEWFCQHSTGDLNKGFERYITEPCGQITKLKRAHTRYVSWITSNKTAHKDAVSKSRTMSAACDVLLKPAMQAEVKNQSRHCPRTTGQAPVEVARFFSLYSFTRGYL